MIFKKIIVIFLLASLISCSSGKTGIVGKYVPYTRFHKLDGDFIVSDEFIGKHSIVLFWASWCNFSKPVIKELSQIASEYKANSNVRFIAASIDKADDFEELKSRIERDKLNNLEQCFSGNENFDEAYIAMHGESIPYIVIVKPDGNVALVSNDADDVREYLEKIPQ